METGKIFLGPDPYCDNFIMVIFLFCSLAKEPKEKGKSNGQMGVSQTAPTASFDRYFIVFPSVFCIDC